MENNVENTVGNVVAKSMFRKELARIRPYSPGKPVEEVKRELGLERIEKLASNENPLGPSPLAIEAMRKELSLVHQYPDTQALALREEIATRSGLGIGSVVVTNGGEHLLQMTAQTLVSEGDEAVMPSPSFDLYASTVSMMGGVPVKVPLVQDEHDFDSMLAAIGPRTRLVYVCNPNNPTGNIVNRASFGDFVDRLPEGVVLFIDEAYYEYARIHPGYAEGIEVLKARPDTIVLRTFSKFAGIAGIRIGYGLTSPGIAAEMSKVRGTFMVNRLAQAAALASISDPEHLARTIGANTASIRMMCDWFRERGFHYVESAANFVFVDLARDSRALFDALLRRGVITRPGHLWGRDTWLRVSSGTLDQTEYFLEQLGAVLRTWD